MKGQILSKERMFCAFFCWENAPKIIWTTQIHHKYVKLMSLPLCVNLLGSNNNSTKSLTIKEHKQFNVEKFPNEGNKKPRDRSPPNLHYQQNNGHTNVLPSQYQRYTIKLKKQLSWTSKNRSEKSHQKIEVLFTDSKPAVDCLKSDFHRPDFRSLSCEHTCKISAQSDHKQSTIGADLQNWTAPPLSLFCAVFPARLILSCLSLFIL